MIRQNLTPGSPYADVMVHGDGLVSLQSAQSRTGRRTRSSPPSRSRGASSSSAKATSSISRWPAPTASCAMPAADYRIALQAPYYVGLALSAHNNTCPGDRRLLQRHHDRAEARVRARHRLCGEGRKHARGDGGRRRPEPPRGAPVRPQDRGAELDQGRRSRCSTMRTGACGASRWTGRAIRW